jgi:hypothetical protein
VACDRAAGGATPDVLALFHAIDGLRPFGGVMMGESGNLFGTTFQGGVNGNNGAVFELAVL